MRPIEEALELVLRHAQPRAPVSVPVADACGRTLAEEITSDIDSPPFDKSLVDGYAVVAADIAVGTELEVIEEIAAGVVPRAAVGQGYASLVMTGAPLPEGAEAVVMVEETERVGAAPDSAKRIRLLADSARRAPNIMRRGTSLRRDQIVLDRGQLIRPIEIGLLSQVGRTSVRVFPPARVAVLPTGNELVSADSYPRPGQIRNSNGPMLAASVGRLEAEPVLLEVARDDRGHLRQLTRQGLQHDLLLLSGGVSAGKWDLVPAVLEELGVQRVFHKVRLKPGKPLWFGLQHRDGPPTLVFGLPGNPVSSLVCFQLLVRPALMRIMGRVAEQGRRWSAALTVSFRHRGDRPTFHPSQSRHDEDGPKVTPLAWQGSADLYTLRRADCLAYFPAGDRQYHPGEIVQVHEL
jgi:molybdopterin molybdotransferase